MTDLVVIRTRRIERRRFCTSLDNRDQPFVTFVGSFREGERCSTPEFPGPNDQDALRRSWGWHLCRSSNSCEKLRRAWWRAASGRVRELGNQQEGADIQIGTILF